MAIGIGHSIGNYRVVKKLGSGGMGTVYLAEHPLIGKKVALKVLHGDLATNAEVLTRFQNEARAVNRIGNDHIVDIQDFGVTADGTQFFVMELLEGESLTALLQRERILTPRRALRIAAQIAGALGAAHAMGILHRDLKPDNVFLITRSGKPDFVKILDFGLAKLLEQAGPSQLTKAGVVLGTPQYMSPEQCESKTSIDARSDVYALGVLLYQMVTGVLPFDGNTMGEILVQHVGQAPRPPRQINGRVPAAVEAIILRCLEKRPADRYSSMADLRGALLEEAAAGRRTVSHDSQPRRSRAALVGAAVGVLAGLSVTGVLLFRSRGQLGPPVVVVAMPRPEAAPPAAPPDAAAPGPTPAVAALPVVDAARVHVTLVSEPPGADIVEGKSGELLGRTPARLLLDRDVPVEIVLRLSGYEDKEQTLRAAADVDLHVELVKSKKPRKPRVRLDDDLLEPR